LRLISHSGLSLPLGCTMKISHPEIESGNASSELESMHTRNDLTSLTTSIDLLEVYQQPEPKVEWKQGLDHCSLLQHMKASLRNTILDTAVHIPDISE
jgi:hypothetical protein